MEMNYFVQVYNASHELTMTANFRLIADAMRFFRMCGYGTADLIDNKTGEVLTSKYEGSLDWNELATGF